MLKTHLTAALSATLLALITGCSPSEPTQTKAATAPISIQEDPRATQPEKPLIASPDRPDPAINAEIEQYINNLATQGFAQENQGVWIQAGDSLLANHQGTTPLSAASVTKIATTLAALQTLGPEHQFITVIGATGPIEDGVLKGDLVIQGGEDPFFVWEDAIPLGNALNEMGIEQVTGNLVIAGTFSMNFEIDPTTSGTLLKQALDSQSWPSEAEAQYLTLPPGTPKPQVAIAGSVQVMPSAPANVQPLVRHRSLPLAEIVKKMNMYSNNPMADMLAESVGGAKVVARKVAEAAGVPPEEIQLINGSGLGEENRISPRAACGMFVALDRYLEAHNMTLADVVAIAGQDLGVLEARQIPRYAVVKTGSLNYVSSIAGAIPTQKQGLVWIVIMNTGGELEAFRAQQDVLLQQLMSKWGEIDSPPSALIPTVGKKDHTSRIEIVNKPSV